jgi:O-antigen/teichoic acid export membrane protein
MVDIGTGMCGAVIDMTGYTRLKVVNAVVQFLLSLSLSILLIPTWGIVGAATAALVGFSSINVLRLLEVFILFRLLPYNLSVMKPVAAGLAGLATALIVDQVLPSAVSPIYAAVSGAMLLIVYIGIILLLGLSPEDRLVLARARRRMVSRSRRR